MLTVSCFVITLFWTAAVRANDESFMLLSDEKNIYIAGKTEPEKQASVLILNEGFEISDIASPVRAEQAIFCADQTTSDEKGVYSFVFDKSNMKVDYNDDIIGTEFCGIIKNIIAISQGILEGMDINYNAKLAFFTKSFLEAKDIIEKLGGKRDTVDQYCGFGDIITASLFPVSRNHTLGVLAGQNIVIDEQATGVLFEGKNTAIVLKEICDKLNIECLTVNFVYDVIILKKSPKKAFYALWEKL